MNTRIVGWQTGGPTDDGLGWTRRYAAGLIATGCAAASLCGASQAGAATLDGARSDESGVRVVVLTEPGAASEVKTTLRRLRGEVDHRLPLIAGFSARLPAGSIDALRDAGGVRSVTVDRRFSVRGDSEPTAAGTSLAQVRTIIGADRLAPSTNAERVDVALIDTGITPVAALSDDSVVNAPDFSADAGRPELRHLDALGHGTHLAGIIAGAGGVAPTARLVNVKVADADGSTSLSQLLAGIDWVVRSRGRDGLNIRVIQLAFGADSQGSYREDPLAMAVERAWQRGIVVVSAAGNGGNDSAGLDTPAVDPFVVAVGASDTGGTVAPEDDAIAPFSSGGTVQRGPDVIAPGAGIVSSRVPDSLLDTQFPAARVGEAGFRGSGTSQSSATVAGAAALILERRSGLQPDEVKAVLTRAAKPLAATDSLLQGRGSVDVAAAVAASAEGARQSWPRTLRAGRIRGLVPRIELAVEDPSASRWGASRWVASRWGASRWGASSWDASRWGASRWGASRWGASRWGAAEWGNGTP